MLLWKVTSGRIVMYCKHCKVKIGCKAEVCPLCHEPITVDETMQQVFPTPNVKRRLHTKFSLIYVILSTFVTLICIWANILTNPNFMWSMMVMVCLIYVYYLVRFTFISQGHFNARIFGQAIVLTVVFFSVRHFIGGNSWIFITWLPLVYFLSELMLGAYMVINTKRARKNIITLITLSIMGTIPTIVAYALDIAVKWPSITVTSFSLAVIIISVIAGRKVILGELKRYFHL